MGSINLAFVVPILANAWDIDLIESVGNKVNCNF